MRKSLFTKHTPAMRGRCKVTVEYDAVFIRELWQGLANIPEAASRMPKPLKKAIDKWMRFFKWMAEEAGQ